MRRIPELDALRALAAVAVVWSHAGVVCRPLSVPWVDRWGWTAVDLFFVVSGYLITSIILRTRETPGFYGRFMLRRSLRIWPIYYLTILGFVAFDLLLKRSYPLAGLPYYLAYLQNVPRYWGADTPAFTAAFSHTWSLAVEEQFYLVWPLLLMRPGRRAIAMLCAGLIVLAITARGLWHFDLFLLVSRCDGLAAGALLALALERIGDEAAARRGRSRALFGVAILALSWLAVVGGPRAHGALEGPAIALQRSVSLFAINGLFAGLVGLCAVHSGSAWLAPLRTKWLVGLGAISYGLYLYHNVLLALVDKLSGPQGPAPAPILAALAASVVAAVASWRWIERPILALKDSLPYAGGRVTVGRGDVLFQDARA
jgi:peptidoglycan/LPS O-acetylase OafA/YrhL